MRYLLLGLIITGCNRFVFDTSVHNDCIIANNTVICPDGEYYELPVPIQSGNEVTLTIDIVRKRECKFLTVSNHEAVYVHNIDNGKQFNVYIGQNCNTHNIKCQNIVTTFDPKSKSDDELLKGKKDCWVGAKQISGVRENNKNIRLYMVDFYDN